jgi:hypothetical protein
MRLVCLRLSRVTWVCVGFAKLGLFMMQFTPCYGIEIFKIINCDFIFLACGGLFQASSMRSSQERSFRMESLCWRIWHIARKKRLVNNQASKKSSLNSETPPPPHFCTKSQFQIFVMNY